MCFVVFRAAIAGSIAEAYHGIPEDLRRYALTFLDDEMVEVVRRFEERF